MEKPSFNQFDLTHDVKTTLKMGRLSPIMAPLEVVPGDKINIGAESLIRFQPTIAPVMHRYDATIHYFFVPNRILWDGWEDYITGGQIGDIPPAHPYLNVTTNYGELADKFGIPVPSAGPAQNVNALPFAAYQLIYNEYYRDQNLIDEIPFKLTNGDNTSNADLTTIRTRAWEHDYFTSCLPFAQKGGEVILPLGTFKDIPVLRNAPSITGQFDFFDVTDTNEAHLDNFPSNNTGVGNEFLYADTSELAAQAADINDLRLAFRLQEFLEKMARGGSRYTEVILSHFGVKTSDGRLQRPEYITGVKQPIVISEVLNTTGTSELPQGNMAGHGIGVLSGDFGSITVEEHGFIIGIMSVLPKTGYMQGLNRLWQKINDKYQYYWPTFANIGEQEVLTRELYIDAPQDEVFGYIPRYAEYRVIPNMVTGDMRTNLDYWHSARKFNDKPSLNQQFIDCNPDNRIFAVTDEDESQLIVMVLNKINAYRPMPKYGTPSF